MISIHRMTPAQRGEVAALIRVSTNAWYESHGRPPIFTGDADATMLFCDVYEAMDPGGCVVAIDGQTGRIAGSCFMHPRPTHVSLGIMNVHPDFFGRGVAGRLLAEIVREADARGLPVRLVSSAINLDSFSLYTRAGFTPRAVYQDLVIADTSRVPLDPPGAERVRLAVADDAPHLAALERELTGVDRGGDYRFFIDNRQGIWRTLVSTDDRGRIDGYLASVRHPGSHMLGPGVARSDHAAAALIADHLRHYAGMSGASLVFLVPADRSDLVATLYRWGARNCELHFAQVRGPWHPPTGVVMPTFMPETG